MDLVPVLCVIAICVRGNKIKSK